MFAWIARLCFFVRLHGEQKRVFSGTSSALNLGIEIGFFVVFDPPPNNPSRFFRTSHNHTSRYPMMLPTRHFARSLLVLWVALVSASAQQVPAQSEPARKKLVLLIGENEYETERTLPAFAAEHLKEFKVVVVSAGREVTNSVFDRMEEVVDADLVLVSVRRRVPPKSQMDILHAYVLAGKPVVGIRTASHAFARGRIGQPEGGTEWRDWDPRVMGGNYRGYHPRGLISLMSAPDPKSSLLEGVKLPFESSAWMYKVTPLASRAEPVLVGTVEGKHSEPVAWTFIREDGGRTFYTSMGMPADFENPSFVALLRNGVRWAAAAEAAVTDKRAR